MFCSNCGKEVNDKAVVCIGCGVELKTNAVQPMVDDKSKGLKNSKNQTLILSILSCFCIALTYSIVIIGLSVSATKGYFQSGTTYKWGVTDLIFGVESWAIILGWILTGLTIVMSVGAVIITIRRNHNEKFSSFLPATLSVVTFIFIFLITVIRG